MPKNDSRNVGKVLNELVQACNDSSMRFHDAVGRLENDELRRIIQELGTQREMFVVELRDHVGRFGEDPADTGTVMENLRRTGREIKSLVLRPDDLREVAVCAAGEETARQRFERALSEVPDELRPLIDRQTQELSRTSQLLGELEETMTQS